MRKMRLFQFFVVVVGVVVVSVQGAPAPAVGSTTYNNPFTVESMLTRNRVKGGTGDLDPQTQNDLRILSFFEEELNKIFSCYIRLSCPRTRSPEVIRECSEIRDWPLYHQVMRMAGIRRYPYSGYGPPSTTPTTVQPPIRPTEVLDNGLSPDENEDGNEIEEDLSPITTPTPTPTTISRFRGGRGSRRMNRRRREPLE